MAIELTTADSDTLASIRNTIGVNLVQLLLPDARLIWDKVYGAVVPSGMSKKIDFTSFSQFRCFDFNDSSYANVSALEGGDALTNLEDLGTRYAIHLPATSNLPTTTLSSFFQSLPVTTKTATIKFTGTAGATDTQLSGTLVHMLTSKGYTSLI